jgi:hypothetical protein
LLRARVSGICLPTRCLAMGIHVTVYCGTRLDELRNFANIFCQVFCFLAEIRTCQLQHTRQKKCYDLSQLTRLYHSCILCREWVVRIVGVGGRDPQYIHGITQWTPFQTQFFLENLVAPGIEPGTSGSVPRNSEHSTTEAVIQGHRTS